jgi:hypothetical protein
MLIPFLFLQHIRFNFVLTDDHLSISAIDANLSTWVLTKHKILSRNMQVRMAGEMWVRLGGDGRPTLHFNGNSGTYRPLPAHGAEFAATMRGLFGHRLQLLQVDL